MLRKLLVMACILMFGASIMGCNTMKGFGRDVQKGGEGIESGAGAVQQEIRQ